MPLRPKYTVASHRMRSGRLTADTAFWSNVAGGGRRGFRTARDYNNYIAQLSDIPRYFEDEIVNMKAGLKRGFTPPQVTMTGRDASGTAWR